MGGVGGVAEPELKSLLGPGSLSAALLLAGKAALSWCAEDSELANSGVDMGALVALGGLSEVSMRDPALAAFQPVLIQACVGHILLELVYNTVLIKRIDPNTKYHLTRDLLAHHLATLATTFFAMVGGQGEYCRGECLQMACELGATEMTTALPVAFHQALINKKLTGARVSFFSLTMPMSFAWRTKKSFSVLRRLHADIQSKGGVGQVHLAWLGLLGTSTLVGLNAWWTFKIVKGALKALRKAGKKGPPTQRGGAKGESEARPPSGPPTPFRGGGLRRTPGSAASLNSEAESEAASVDPLSPLRIA